MPKLLREYARMRNFRKTPEPDPAAPRTAKGTPLIFVVQEHHASHLHYDFRLEWKGVLRSWAVPKGPSMVAGEKRLAVEVEDHPLAYAKFAGKIPEGEYGAGMVCRWDFGTWEPLDDPEVGLRAGRLEFRMKGKKLKGAFLLVRTRSAAKKPQWLLIKRRDKEALTKISVRELTEARPKAKKMEKREDSDAVASSIPDFVAPELATLVDEPPAGDDWIHEAKFDGYRIEAKAGGGDARLLTRSGADWTAVYPTVTRELRRLKLRDALLDGELVWLETDGHTDFQYCAQWKRQDAHFRAKKPSRGVFLHDLRG